MSEDSLSDKPFDRASELLMKFAQRETVAKAPVVATQHEVTPAPVVQAFEPRPFTLQAGGEGQAGGGGGGGGGGTYATPYVLGTDRTTTDPTPADDTWDKGSPPTGTDGVTGNWLRRVLDSGSTVTYLGDGTNIDTFIVTPVKTLVRTPVFDSSGSLVSLSAEVEADSFIDYHVLITPP